MRRGSALIWMGAAAIVVVLILLFTGAVGGDSGGNGGKNGNGGEDCDAVLLAVAVFDKEDHVLGAAEVTVIGPYPIVPGVTPEHTGTTDFFGVAKIELPKPGEYDIAVSREGYEDASLVGRDDQMVARAPEIVCGGNLVRVELDRVGEAPPPSPPADNGGNGGGNVPSSGEGGPPPDVDENAFAYVFTVGVKTKDDVCRSLSIHRIISSCEEINEPEEVVKSGTGWSTFVRSGQTIHVVGGVSYSEEPFWRVTFKEARKDGLEEVFVQRACGNVSAPPGKTMPPKKPFQPKEEVTPPAKTPTVPPPPPSATNTPRVPHTATPVPPTATPKATETPRPPATQTAAPTQTTCCTPVPDYTRPAKENTPVNTIVVPTATPVPQQTVRPPGSTNTPIAGGNDCGLFC